MGVSEQDSAFDRGRIPAHEVRAAMVASITLLEAKVGVGRHRACLMMFGCDVEFQQSTVHVAARSYMEMISDHFMSYNKFSGPYFFMNSSELMTP